MSCFSKQFSGQEHFQVEFSDTKAEQNNVCLNY